MDAFPIEVFTGTVMTEARAIADGGHRVRGTAEGVGVGKAVSKLDFVLIPVPSQNCLNLSIKKGTEQEPSVSGNEHVTPDA